MKHLLIFLFPLCIFAQDTSEPILSPQEIQVQLNQDETLFKQAKEMFNPWYAGPLLTGGAHMMPPGYIGIQPYVFVSNFYAAYNSHWHAVDAPDLIQLNPQITGVAGVTSWLDAAFAVQADMNWKQSRFHWGFGDLNITAGLKLLSEGVYIPALKLGVGETFPTGRYENLKASNVGTDAIGAGSYQTAFSFRIAKLVLWQTQHPLNLRATYTYTIPSTVSVKNLNVYGGGAGTRGKVRPGNQSNLSVGMEWSFTQKWVFCNDFVYVHNNRTKFSGTPGVTSSGATATVGLPSTEQFSLCPGIEYNPTPDLNFLAGVWFTALGRNSSTFYSGVLSASYTFSVKGKNGS